MTPLLRPREALAIAAAVFLLLLLASGLGLMTAYVPSDKEAFDSVLYLRKAGGALAFLRSLHAHLASGLVAVGGLFLLATFLEGSPSRERFAWWGALAVFALALFACFTGFPLPMDQNAYWGTVVRLGIVETVPFVGGLLADLLRGGPTWNASTLTRFYALHAGLLPVIITLAAVALAVLAAPAARADAARTRRLLVSALAVVALAYAFAAWIPARLEPRAAAGDVDYVPRPEWYFLWLFQFGKYVESLPWIRSLLLPALIGGVLVGAPYITPVAARARAAAASCAVLFLFGLHALARYDDRALPLRPSYEQALAARAVFLFKEECTNCHGSTGKGDGTQARSFGMKTPDFNAAEFWKGRGDDTMRESIKGGKGDDMPAFQKKLSAEEIDALIELVKARFRPR